MPVDPVAVAIALSAGAATFFSPCAVSLVPAYAGYFVALDEEKAAKRDIQAATLAGARFSGAAAAGILGVFAVGSAFLYVVREVLDRSLPALGDAVVWLGVAIGAILVAVGVLLLVGRGERFELTPRLPAPKRKTTASMAAFGGLFAIGSVGCSLSVFIPIVVRALAQGPLGALATLMAYGVGLAAVMVAVGIGLAVAKEQVHQRIRRIVPYFRPVAGVILILGGLYTAWYYGAVLTV